MSPTHPLSVTLNGGEQKLMSPTDHPSVTHSGGEQKLMSPTDHLSVTLSGGEQTHEYFKLCEPAVGKCGLVG